LPQLGDFATVRPMDVLKTPCPAALAWPLSLRRAGRNVSGVGPLPSTDREVGNPTGGESLHFHHEV